jgi:hypothetical protein
VVGNVTETFVKIVSGCWIIYTDAILLQNNQRFLLIPWDQKHSFSENLISKESLNWSNFTPPIYNVWTQQSKSNKVNHFGNSEPVEEISEKMANKLFAAYGAEALNDVNTGNVQ